MKEIRAMRQISPGSLGFLLFARHWLKKVEARRPNSSDIVTPFKEMSVWVFLLKVFADRSIASF
jgi:hypothetical protein